MDANPIKIGLIAELTGPLSFMGIANANLTTMLVDDINERGGLLGRRVELIVEDGMTTDSVAKARAAKLIDEDKVDLVVGGIYSSTRQAIKSEAVARGKTLYIYTEQYEGQESDPLIFCTGPVPAQQVEPLIRWVIDPPPMKFSNRGCQCARYQYAPPVQSSLRGLAHRPPHVGVGWWIGRSGPRSGSGDCRDRHQWGRPDPRHASWRDASAGLISAAIA
jgi:Periplasmic binding protein domain